LADLGVRTLFHTTVGDDPAANVQVFAHAAARADIVVASGGLGPTADDLTRQALADTMGVELVMNQSALDDIKALFARRKREMPERNVMQAMFPRGGRVIPNPHGTAPGIDADVPSGRTSRFFCLPGVPAEMKEMFAAYVAPAILQQLGPAARPIYHRVIRCFGVGESDLEAMLPDLIQRGRDPIVGITVSQATISLRISCAAASRAEALERMEPTVQTIHQCLGKLVFGEGEEELPHAIVRLLAQRSQTLATLECGTGGMLAEWLSAAAGEASTFVGGSVDRRIANDAAALKAATEAMRMALKTDYALAIGPFPPLSTPPGDVLFALATPTASYSKSALFAGHPDIVKDLTAKRALNWLRLHLLGDES
jgi:nicotinamide-nucleotide amidase